MLFNGFSFIILIVYFDALVVSDIASKGLFRLASVSFQHMPIFFFFFLSTSLVMAKQDVPGSSFASPVSSLESATFWWILDAFSRE